MKNKKCKSQVIITTDFFSAGGFVVLFIPLKRILHFGNKIDNLKIKTTSLNDVL